MGNEKPGILILTVFCNQNAYRFFQVLLRFLLVLHVCVREKQKKIRQVSVLEKTGQVLKKSISKVQKNKKRF
jgi:hypothetical protein